MVKRPSQIKRARAVRDERKTIYIAAEGNNKTERYYFELLNREQKGCRFQYLSGGDTDPEGMVKNVIGKIDHGYITPLEDDEVWCLIDTDTDQGKQKQIEAGLKLADSKNIKFAISNPCFEVWPLLHIRYSTKSYSSSDEVIRELKKSLPDYRKNSGLPPEMLKKTKSAVTNARQLELYHDQVGNTARGMSRNPSTEVYQIIEDLYKSKEKQ